MKDKKPRFRIDLEVFIMLHTLLLDNTLTRWQTLQLKRAFEDYLVALNNETLLDIPDSVIKLFIDMNHPLKTNGFNPETILHFVEFIKINQAKSK